MRVRRSDDGAVAILVAVLAVVMFGFAALVVDLGMARDIKQQASDSADAAALAGAAQMSNCTRTRCTAATDAAMQYAAANFDVAAGEWRRCRATPPTDNGWSWSQRASRTQCIQYSAPSDTKPTLIFVALPPRSSPSFFGGILGYTGTDISSSAVAGTEDVGAPPCGLCVLGRISASGGTLSVGTGSIYATDADTSGGFVNDTEGIFLTNRWTGSGFAPRPVVTDLPVTDPFAGRSAPTAPNTNRRITTCNTGDPPLAPGRYRNLTVVGDCRMAAGVFQFRGQLTVQAAGSLRPVGLAGVTLVFTNRGSLLINDGQVDLGPPAAGQSFSLFAQGSGGSIHLNFGGLNLDGDVYAQNRSLISAGSLTLNGTTVVGQLSVTSGSATVNSAGNGVAQSGPQDLALVK